ncbi:MAG: hypothetical protein ACT4QB_05855 [Gammaproteobacteria bacterium]
MVNTKHGRFTSAFWRPLGVLALSVPLGANALEISNGIPEGTIGHYRVDVETGGETRTAFITAARFDSNDIATSEVVFDYSSLVDTGVAGQGFSLSLSGSDPVPDPNIPNSVTSSGEFPGATQNSILWKALSSIAPGAQTMTTQYTFATEDGSPLGALRFLQYLDEDVQGAGDDVFFSTGSPASGNLELFTFDNRDVYGISHSGALVLGPGLQNAAFAGWAADRFNNMRPLITGAGQPVSPDGMIAANLVPFPHPQLGPVFGGAVGAGADIVSVMAWDADPNATSAVITTSLGGVPISVESRPLSDQVRCRGLRCSVPVTCVFADEPGASCTNQVRLLVTRRALRTRDGALERAPGVLFASGSVNVATGQNGTVRPRLTPRARRFVRSTTKKRINGTLEIRSIAGSAINTFPVTIRIK